MVKTLVKRGYAFVIFFFLYAPILMLMVYSFNNSKSRANWDGFTFKWYIELLSDRQIMTSLYYTLALAVISSIVATVVGTAAAIGIHNMRMLPKAVTMNITYLPILNPDIVTGISLMLLFIFVKIPLGFFSMLLAHITFNMPFVILSVMPKLKQINAHIFDAALDLGASHVYAYRKIILPQIMSGVLTGFLLAFTMSFDDFVVSFFTTGSGVSNLAITIYSMARRGINPKINALLTIMFISILLLLIIINNRMSKDEDRKGNKNEKIS